MPDAVELARLVGEKFISRKDVKAFQRPDGAWFPVTGRRPSDPLYATDPQYEPMKMSDFTRHFSGEQTMGHYMLGADGNCKLFAFDLDLRKSAPDADPPFVPLVQDDEHEPYPCDMRAVWLDPTAPQRPYLCVALRTMADGLAMSIHRRLQVPVAIADSGGKGLHVYAFTGSLPASTQRELAKGILEGLGMEPTKGDNFYRPIGYESKVEVEVFPKQDSLDGKNLGNLMKLPLGINQKSKRPSTFITSRAGYDTLQPMDPIDALSGDLPWE